MLRIITDSCFERSRRSALATYNPWRVRLLSYESDLCRHKVINVIHTGARLPKGNYRKVSPLRTCPFRPSSLDTCRPVTREHYLRPATDFPPVPDHVPTYVCLDTNVVLHQIDLLQSPHFPLPLLVPQTVLDEVRHRSLPLYNKLKALIDEDFASATDDATDDRAWLGKRGVVVWNEAMEETYLVKNKGESPNDRNDRGASGSRFTPVVKLTSSPPITLLPQPFAT